MNIKTLKSDGESSAPTAKKPYVTPVLKEWGTLKDITLSTGNSRSSDNASRSRGPQKTGP